MTDIAEYVNPDTAEIVAQLTRDEAAELTRDIAGELDFTWNLVTAAYQGRAWAALGYESWDSYCTNEFGTSRLALPREERSDVVLSLRQQGLSLRAIAAATGVDPKTVRNDLRGGESSPPESTPITGIDGKTYAPTKVTERESFSRTTEYGDHEPAEGDEEVAPMGTTPETDDDLDLDDLADRILPDEVNYRPVLSSAIERAGSALRNLDVDRAANAIRTADDADGYRRSLRDMRDCLDQILKATQPDHLRSVK